MAGARWVALFLLAFPVSGQDLRHFPSNYLSDQKVIWTSPLHLTRKQAKVLVPFAAITAALIATDRRTSGAMPNTPGQIDTAGSVSNAAIGAVGALAGGMFVLGRLVHDERAAEAGLLSAEAAADAFTLGEVLKFATNRQRPYQDAGHGRFWAGGRSFPSGHSFFSWSIAETIASEYRDRPLIRFGAYGLAALASISRFPARQHFPSDILTGGTAGWLIGRYVWRAHHQRTGGIGAPVPSVQADARTHTYALMLAWHWN